MTETNNAKRGVNQYTALPMPERFWSKVDRSKGPNGCWLWLGSKHRQGYGMFKFAPDVLAHRVAWILTNGPILDGMSVLHNCPDGDNPTCVNPSHMFLGTQLDNIRDRESKGRGNGGGLPGEACGHSKLTQHQVDEIRANHAAGNITQTELARRFGVSIATVSLLIHRKTWR